MRHLLRRLTIFVASFLALGLGLKAVSPAAEASYGLGDSLETVGIATGIGTVLGLSTIAFYDKPTSHMSNALVGAGAGLLVGLGVAAYMMATSPEGDDISPEELLPPENRPTKKEPAKTDKKNGAHLLRQMKLRRQIAEASVPATLGNVLPNPSSQKGWLVAVRVLELRF